MVLEYIKYSQCNILYTKQRCVSNSSHTFTYIIYKKFSIFSHHMWKTARQNELPKLLFHIQVFLSRATVAVGVSNKYTKLIANAAINN